MSSYAWVITRDLFAEEFDDESTDVGTWGPHGATEDMVAAAKAKGVGVSFKMYDGDGNHVYSGRIWHRKGKDHCEFQPLRDFGEPNFGCTEIRYRNAESGEWEAL